MARPNRDRPLNHPLYWPTWVGMGIFYLLNKLPWPIKRGLAATVGQLIYFVVPVRRRVAFTNLRIAFPELSDPELRRLARAHYRSLALGLFETCAAWWSPSNRLPKYEIRGREHLEAAAAAEQGALVLTAHVTLLEMGARIINEQFTFCALYRDPNNPVVAEIMRRSREHHLRHAIPFEDLRGLVRALKEGNMVWYAPDQAKRTKMSELIPFFGEPAITNVATSRIAKMSSCCVVPYYAHRDAHGTYILEAYPAWENFPSGDHTADAQRVNDFIESQVRQNPDQYFWVHKRYKRRGDDLPDVYDRKS
ncbi:MAG: LpxL/LpxP family Kdo(2)-lipid IV(A) lauroyl/palmitoleoyl acyltransferase [Synoicihabitans sp.]